MMLRNGHWERGRPMSDHMARSGQAIREGRSAPGEGGRAPNGHRTAVVCSPADELPSIRAGLERAGLGVREVDCAEAVRRAVADAAADLVVLDATMPAETGWRALSAVRELCQDIPVLVLTPPEARADRIRALEAGADDSLSRPLHDRELAARAQALLRRRRPSGGEAAGRVYRDAALEVDFLAHSVSYRGRRLLLSPLEFRLLATFVRHPGQLLTQERLLAEVWGAARGVSVDQVKLYVSYLRRKLGTTVAASPIQTVRGLGYRYDPPRVAAD
jgi:DNA-binding response OmpR family regulator